MRDAFIFDTCRTPRARRKGKYSKIHPVDLMTLSLNGLIARNGIPAEAVEDLILGCVTQTGEQGWCVARAAVLAAGFPISVPGTTVNRLCGSGQQATNFGAQGIQSGNNNLLITGGLEHMTRVPMFSDGGGEKSPALQKEHPGLVDQGPAAELMSKEFGVTREEADRFSYESQMRAKVALEEKRFQKSLIPVNYTDPETGEAGVLIQDDNPRPSTTLEGLASLKPVFQEDGILTAGNSSAIVDGCAAILIGSQKAADKYNLTPRARIVSMAAVGSPPRVMLTGPIGATQKALKQADLAVDEIDLWEINEAFAPVPLITMQEVEIDPKKVNVNGGAIALGHPLGATGAILIGTLLDELERQNKKLGCVTMCIGLGMGIATVIERL
ncbi:MAG: thiolase family protein [Bdellovibrionales bacterium]|nr:thiolase family protein [Bdellovibrionales bacterium]